MLVLRYWNDRQVQQETALLKETVEGAAKVLSEAAATTKTATDAAKQASVTRLCHRVIYYALDKCSGLRWCVGSCSQPRKYEKDGRVLLYACLQWHTEEALAALPIDIYCSLV